MFCVFSKLFLLLFSGKKKEKEKEKHQVHPARFELRTAQAKIGITFQFLAARECKQHSFFFIKSIVRKIQNDNIL